MGSEPYGVRGHAPVPPAMPEAQGACPPGGGTAHMCCPTWMPGGHVLIPRRRRCCVFGPPGSAPGHVNPYPSPQCTAAVSTRVPAEFHKPFLQVMETGGVSEDRPPLAAGVRGEGCLAG